jgi:hypothetical protein
MKLNFIDKEDLGSIIVKLTVLKSAFLLEFQQNSKIATTTANARPHKSTTNTPPATHN